MHKVQGPCLAASVPPPQHVHVMGASHCGSMLLPQGAALKEAQARAEAAQRQVLRLEAQVAALEESQRSLVQSKNDIEGGMLEGGCDCAAGPFAFAVYGS